MTDTELEQLIDGTLAEFLSSVEVLSEPDLQQVRAHPVVTYPLYRVTTPAERREHFPAAEE